MPTFMWPTDTKRVTSEFRTNERPDHHGVDIADPGAHPIYAIANGIVTRSYRSPSYGECIFIEHDIDGQVWESVYAHMRENSRGHNVGDRVKQGTQIGVMGNTGHSNGQHLHLELHKGKWNHPGKTNAVDPLDYLDKELSKPDYKVVAKVNGYSTAADAKAKKDKKTTVKPGTYYVFNESLGMVNVTSKAGVPGSWINPSENKKKESPIIYTVENGDNLSHIADRFGVTVDSIVKHNNIKDKNVIYRGQKLEIHGAKTKKYHTVKPGDSLSKIANKYDKRLDEIKKLNPQVKGPNYIIHAGDKIRVQ